MTSLSADVLQKYTWRSLSRPEMFRDKCCSCLVRTGLVVTSSDKMPECTDDAERIAAGRSAHISDGCFLCESCAKQAGVLW